MRFTTRLAAAAVAVCGLAAGLVACGTDEGTGTDGKGAAPADGPLVIYSGRSEDLVAPLIEDFKKETGIETEVRYGKTAEQAQLLLTEGDDTRAHVFFSQEAGALGLLQDKGMLADVPGDLMKKVPSGFSSEEGKWVGVTGRARVVAYDKESVDEADAPDTAAGMVDPKWKGKIAIAPGNASFLSFVTAMRVTEGEDAARDWLKKLAANEPKTYEKNGDVLEAVNKGEAQIGLINHYYWYSAASEQGADKMRAQLKFGADGDLAGLVNATGAGILTGAAEREDAKKFVEFLLSEKAQKYFAEKTYEYPLVEGIKGPEGVPALDSLKVPDVDLSKLGTVEETAALIDEAGLTVN
ncbi:iron ABC transporter substrate-binding protein [Corynebacterium hansenii]|uniref:Iron ABC transporter substrate-binding protein n=1 Tax=Corynebacterium hansenii TaxID=394964 RepID=A0ABV7ZQ43_9CORY|nr:iron ABC transporter substrate-binding protein [Corynebacterium hansenii]WJZ00979.1 Iron-utilization periplasmic protein precursor [Corynebacterium hansenii]